MKKQPFVLAGYQFILAELACRRKARRLDQRVPMRLTAMIGCRIQASEDDRSGCRPLSR